MRMIVGLILLMSVTSYAADGVITLRSTVKGNQEQPKVMYVLPWQAADRIEMKYRPDTQWLGEVFAPVDRDEFIRELNYRKQSRDQQQTAGQ